MDPEDLNLRQLRSELKRIGLSPSGLKQILVKRLKTALEEDGKVTIPLENVKDIPNRKYRSEHKGDKDSKHLEGSHGIVNKRKTFHAPKIILNAMPQPQPVTAKPEIVDPDLLILNQIPEEDGK